MNEAEFRGVLALHGWELKQLSGIQGICVGRIVQPVLADDVSQGPYRYDGMSKTIFEIGAPRWEDAVQALITLYQSGSIK